MSACMLPSRCRSRLLASRSRPSELPHPRVSIRGRGARRLPRVLAAQAQGAGTQPVGPILAGAPHRQAVIVGAGPAGDAVAAGLRDGGFWGRITLIGSEQELPYERPHLSKEYLLGKIPRERLGLRPQPQYRQLGIDLELGRRVVDLGIDERRVLLEDGGTIGWDLLCITTGSG